jgi:hypothetical protein
MLFQGNYKGYIQKMSITFSLMITLFYYGIGEGGWGEEAELFSASEGIIPAIRCNIGVIF